MRSEAFTLALAALAAWPNAHAQHGAFLSA